MGVRIIRAFKSPIFAVLILIVLGGLGFAFLDSEWFFAETGLLVLLAVSLFLPQVSARPVVARDEEREELWSVVGSMNDGLIVYDQHFRIGVVNPAAEKLFGIRAVNVVGRIILPQDIGKDGMTRLAQVMFPTLAPGMILRSKSGETPQVVDLSFESPDMELRTMTSPIRGADGKHLGFMKIIRDRTRESSLFRSKTEFITVASHQLRTPVTGIVWAMESLAQNQNLPPDVRELVQNAFISARRLRNLVEDLLNISKIEEGRFGYEFRPADAVSFLDKILAETLPQAKQFGIKLFFDRPDAALPQVYVDESKLTMAVLNLLDNAIRYNVKNGEIVVSARKSKEGPFVEIIVKDTGIGIPREEIKKLFSKFFRAENALRFNTEGSGLGLYIAKNIIESHGGRIAAESESNRGSVFTFFLPTDPDLVPKREAPLEL